MSLYFHAGKILNKIYFIEVHLNCYIQLYVPKYIVRLTALSIAKFRVPILISSLLPGHTD